MSASVLMGAKTRLILNHEEPNTRHGRIRDVICSSEPLAPWPTGFDEYDQTLAYKFLRVAQFECQQTDGEGCWGLSIISRDGCPSGATVTLDGLDDFRNKIETIDGATQGPVAPGERVQVLVNSYAADASTADVSRIVCQ